MICVLTLPEQTLLREIADKKITRKSLAVTYALAIRSGQYREMGWPKVNKAIMQRWSVSGLVYIKERAHKILTGKVQL